MKIEVQNPMVMRCYEYLKRNAVGRENRKSRQEIATALNVPLDEVQTLVREIRKLQLKKICSMSGVGGGVWIPLENEIEHKSLRSRCFSSIESSLMNGDVTPQELIGYVVNVAKKQNIALDNQMKMQLGDYEEIVVHKIIHYEDMTRQQLYDIVKQLDPYFPLALSCLSQQDLINEIRQLKEV